MSTSDRRVSPRSPTSRAYRPPILLLMLCVLLPALLACATVDAFFAQFQPAPKPLTFVPFTLADCNMSTLPAILSQFTEVRPNDMHCTYSGGSVISIQIDASYRSDPALAKSRYENFRQGLMVDYKTNPWKTVTDTETQLVIYLVTPDEDHPNPLISFEEADLQPPFAFTITGETRNQSETELTQNLKSIRLELAWNLSHHFK